MVKLARKSSFEKVNRTFLNDSLSVLSELFILPILGSAISADTFSAPASTILAFSVLCNACIIGTAALQLYIKHRISPSIMLILFLHYLFTFTHLLFSAVVACLQVFIFFDVSWKKASIVSASTLVPMVVMFIAAELPLIRDEWAVTIYVSSTTYYIISNIETNENRHIAFRVMYTLFVIISQYTMCFIYKETLYIWYHKLYSGFSNVGMFT